MYLPGLQPPALQPPASRLQTARERTAGRNISPVQHPNRVSSRLRELDPINPVCLSWLVSCVRLDYPVAQIVFNVPGSTPPSVLFVSLPTQGRSPCSKWMKAEKLPGPSASSGLSSSRCVRVVLVSSPQVHLHKYVLHYTTLISSATVTAVLQLIRVNNTSTISTSALRNKAILPDEAAHIISGQRASKALPPIPSTLDPIPSILPAPGLV